MNTNREKLRDACELAAQTFRKLSNSEHQVIISKLEYCIGSFNYDKNPSGLYEFGYQALNLLKNIKQKNSRKVNKTVITSLEGALTN